MSTWVLLAATGLGLGALYFLLAAGLSLIFGLMRVLNLAHGAFLTVGAYLGYEAGIRVSSGAWWALLVAIVVASASAALFAVLVEVLIMRRLYEREIEQVLVTLGISLATVALVHGIWGGDPVHPVAPDWVGRTTTVLGAAIPNNRLVCIAAALLVLVALLLVLTRTRYGLIVRAGVENRAMVTALGIDVRTTFTIMFAIGGAVAGLGGVLAGVYFGDVSPERGSALLIFALIVVVVGGPGSILGSAIAAVGLGLVQQFVNYYGPTGTGDIAVVLVLALVLLVRPEGLMRGAT